MRVDEGLSSTELAALDQLELELRKLPEVLAVGFEGPAEGSSIATDAVITVHVFVSGDAERATIEQQAVDLGRLYVDRPLRIAMAPEGRVEVAPAAARTPGLHRPALMESSLTRDGASVEVTIAFEGDRAVGSGSGTALSGAAEATLAALRELGWLMPFTVLSCARLTLDGKLAVLVHLGGAGGDRFGVSAGAPPQQAAAKATLHALNRWLDDPARRPAALRHEPSR